MTKYNPKSETLYNGSELNKSTLDDFKERLNHHYRGEGVSDHGTADALFVVQTKKMVTGLDTDYTDEKCIHDHEDCETYYSLESFIENLDEDSLEYYELNDFENSFLEMAASDQWDCLRNVNQLSVSGFSEEWQYVNCHFTKEAAQRFIDRKQHDYGELRIYVDSQYWCWEFKSIVNAILDGKLVLKESI